jgi:aspartyl-tRNA(Asn)/glutamyl-tRNA(Gln) amidotransferase subunit C
MTRLALDAEELERIARDLGDVLEHFDRIREVDISSVTDEEIAHPGLVGPADRPDEPASGLDVSEVLRLAPETRDGLVIVPRFVGGEDAEA